MIDLARHIEVLLLENDCVIVPNLGGFVAHQASAMRTGDNVFVPPTRTIGFNPQLKLNDGLLVQSYMAVYDTNFSDATKIVEEEVAELITTLHNEGKVDLANIGELRYTIYDAYEFIPYSNKITTPYLYGLDSFEMEELSVLRKLEEKVLTPVIHERNKSHEFKISRAVWRNAVAVVAAIVLFFGLSTPLENTSIEKDNYAQLLPMDVFERIGAKSVVTTPIDVKQESKRTVNAVKTPSSQRAVSGINNSEATTKPFVVKEVKVAKPVSAGNNKKTDSVQSGKSQLKQISTAVTVNNKQTNDNYHIIVAGGIGLKDAEIMAEQLKSKGFAGAKALNNGGKVRVSIMSFATRAEAMKQLLKLRENEAYKTAWMLAK